jgi:5-methylcytosine-specific restriction endonuclease McrA
MAPVTILQEQILRLRNLGLSYRAIATQIPCSLYSVHYALNKGARSQVATRNRHRRRSITAKLKSEFGGQCAVCGYNRCLEALEFDHIRPEDKSSGVSCLRLSLSGARREALKCLLLCCRCHRERHAGIIDIGGYLEPSV